mgnify:CR=1 FL=1
MTGVQFDQIVSRKLGAAYTGFYDSVVRKPDVYKESLIAAITSCYTKDDEQRDTDKLVNLISQAALTLAASEYTLTTLTNYYHLLALRCLCQDYNFDFTGATLTSNISPNQISFTYSNQLRDKEIVQINGTNYYVKTLRPKVYALYTDEGLITPTPADNKTLTSPKRLVNYYAKQQYADQLIGLYGKPSIYLPRVTFADGKLKVAPDAVSATLHYIKTLPVNIDPLDDVADLETYYPYDLLIDAANKACEIVAKEKRAWTLYGAQKADNQQSTTVLM